MKGGNVQEFVDTLSLGLEKEFSFRGKKCSRKDGLRTASALWYLTSGILRAKATSGPMNRRHGTNAGKRSPTPPYSMDSPSGKPRARWNGCTGSASSDAPVRLTGKVNPKRARQPTLDFTWKR